MPYTARLKPRAEKHYWAWQKHEPRVADKIDELLEAIEEDPYHGIGKPEQLRGMLRGYWSRRITEQHRLIYKVEGKDVFVFSCHCHYDQLWEGL